MNFNFFGREIVLSRYIMVAVVSILLAGAGIAGFIIRRSSGDVVILSPDKDISVATIQAQSGTQPADTQVNGTKEAAGDVIETSKEEAANEIKVYVVGCVKKPGVVTLKKGQIIEDAINAAGGATEEADLENINLVYQLSENVMLKVISKKERQALMKPAESQKPASSQPQAKSSVEIVRDSGGAVKDEVDVAEKKKESAKVNINTASIEELDTLPGVGESTAKKNIAHRDKNGSFQKIEDIMKVSGIGESKFNSIKDSITIE